MKTKIPNWLTPPASNGSTGISYFREQLLFYLLLALACFGTLAYLPSVYYGYIYQFNSVIFIDTLVLAWVFMLLIRRRLSFTRKCMGFLGVFYILGVWLLVTLGPTGAGFMWLLLFSVMAGVLLGFKAALGSFCLNATTFVGLSILISKGVVVWQLIHSDAIAIWTVKGINFVCINAILSISTGFLITKIARMVKDEQQRRYALAREMKARLLAEKEAKELTARLYQSHKMEALGTLAGGVAHDFNNILNSIMGYAEFSLLETDLPPTAKSSLVRILKAAERAQGIAKQILTFSRRGEATMVPCDLGGIVNECIDFFRINVPKDVALVSDLPRRPFPVLADKNQIYQVIMNLLTNSLQALEGVNVMRDATTGYRGKITLKLEKIPSQGDTGCPLPRDPGRIILTVTDTGKGIPESLIPRVFDPYFTTKEPGKGSGMGLSISHGIIKAHGGTIQVESPPGQGATFKVKLPPCPGTEKITEESSAPDDRVLPPGV